MHSRISFQCLWRTQWRPGYFPLSHWSFPIYKKYVEFAMQVILNTILIARNTDQGFMKANSMVFTFQIKIISDKLIMGLKNGFAFLDSVIIIIIMGPWMVSISLTGYINLYLLLIRWCWRNNRKTPYENKTQMTQWYVKTTLMGLHKWKWKYRKTLWPLRAWLFRVWAFCTLYFSIYLPVFETSPCPFSVEWKAGHSRRNKM